MENHATIFAILLLANLAIFPTTALTSYQLTPTLRSQGKTLSPASIPVRQHAVSLVLLSEKGGDLSPDSKKPEEGVLAQLSNEITDITTPIKDVWGNIFEGEVGSRGELYVLAQGALIFFILSGDVPYLGKPLSFIFGPGMILYALGFAVSSVAMIGDALSPFPAPVKKEGAYGLKTGGAYTQMRHPMYSALLAFMIGVSFVSSSPLRIFLTAGLYYVLEKKTVFEEKMLIEAYPEYEEYKNVVTTKFVPMILDDILTDISNFRIAPIKEKK